MAQEIEFVDAAELSVSSGRQLARGLSVYDSSRPEPACEITADGRVLLRADLDLEAVKRLPLPYLKMLREVVNTAIYDAEKGN